MRKKETQPISLKYVVFIIAIVAFIIFYATSPNDTKNITKTKTYEEQLEYNNRAKSPQQNNRQTSQQQQRQQRTTSSGNKPSQQPFKQNTAKKADLARQQAIKTPAPSAKSTTSYNKLLNILAATPGKSYNSIEIIVNKILDYKGYPAGLIKIVPESIDQSKAKTQGSFLIAAFEFPTGEMKVSKEQIYNLDTKMLISILAHELDHFEKIAQVYKSIGKQEFKNIMSKYGVNRINEEFWDKTTQYTDISSFDANTYKTALERYLNQNKIDLTSSYSDFYRLAENIRNPLEISAYEVSDYIQNFYGIPITDGPMKNITQKFNEVDWAIYNLISKNDIIKNERIALFDYFFSKAIMATSPGFRRYYDNCINSNDGDLSMFWLSFEKTLSNFYGTGQLDSKSLNLILNLLTATKKEAEKGISDTEIADALKYKVKILQSNIVFPNAIKYMKKTATAYLKFIKSKQISDPKTELDFILTLICAENELYKNNNKAISLYYLKMPDDLIGIYNANNRNQRFKFIYNNQEFQRLIKLDNKTEQNLLTELLESHRLNVRIAEY